MTSHNLRPFREGEFRQNPDGSRSTEITMTVQLPGGVAINIPSLFMGPDGPVQFRSEQQALRAALAFEKRSGRQFPRFRSIERAVTKARGRSRTGGIANGPLATSAPFMAPFPQPRPFADGLKR